MLPGIREGFTPVDNGSRTDDCSYHLRSHLDFCISKVDFGILCQGNDGGLIVTKR